MALFDPLAIATGGLQTQPDGTGPIHNVDTHIQVTHVTVQD